MSIPFLVNPSHPRLAKWDGKRLAMGPRPTSSPLSFVLGDLKLGEPGGVSLESQSKVVLNEGSGKIPESTFVEQKRNFCPDF